MTEQPGMLDVATVNDYLGESMPSFVADGMRVEHLEPDVAVVRLPYVESKLRPGGIIAGPTLMSLTDLAVWVAIFTRRGITPMAVTWDLKINFLRAARGGDVLATARILKLGRQLVYATVEMVVDGRPDEIVAHATVTYALPSAGATT